MARSLSSQILATYNESQRRAQRAKAAEERFRRAQFQEQIRAQRAAERARVQYDRDSLRAYQTLRENDAATRTRQITDTVAELDQVLATLLRSAPFRIEALRRQLFVPPPFNPGHLGVPVPMPDPGLYQVPNPTGLRMRTAKAKQEYDATVARARAAYDQHYRESAGAEQERLRALAEYRAEVDRWAERERQAVLAYNQAVDSVGTRYAAGDDDALLQLLSSALSASSWPDSFPRESRAAWDGPARQLVIDWQLPGFDVVPHVSRYRYVKTSDQENEVARPVAERKAMYRRLLAQCTLRVVSELFRADYCNRIHTIVLNGYIRCVDPATGKMVQVYVSSLTADLDVFTVVDLSQIEPVSCLAGLKGQLSTKPDVPIAVRPVRLPESVRGFMDESDSRDDGDEPDLLEMDPIEFEELVADLFGRMNLKVMTTKRSGDEGVDIVAMDPDPVRGGKIVIQVKRYKATVSPAVVRELYGTVIAQGASKGILVTTSGYGPGSREFAHEKQLSLIDGRELLHHMAQYGIPGKLGA